MMGRCASPATSSSILLDSLNRHLLGAYGGDRVRHAEPRSARRPVAAVRPAPHRLAAVHAGPPRHPRAARSTSCGGRGARSSCGRTPITYHLRPRRGDDDARVRPPAPVRDRRRELPHRLQRAGTTCAATRATRGARRPTRRGSGAPALPAREGWIHHHYDTSPHLVPRRGRLPRRPRRWPRPPGGWPGRRRRPTASCCSSTSSTRTSRSTRPSRGRRATTPTGTGPKVIWPPYAVDAVATGRHRRPRPPRTIRANYGAKLSDDRPLARPGARRARPPGPVGRHRGRSCAPTTATTSARTTSSASPACPCTSRSVTSRCSSPGRAAAGRRRRAHDHASTCTPRCATSSA